MGVFGRRHSILAAVALAVAASGRRRPVDLLQVDLLPVDLLQVLDLAEILLVAVVAAVGHRWFHLRSRQSF